MSAIEYSDAQLGHVDALVTGMWARPVTWRQPTHTVYIPADKLTADLPRQWARAANELVDSHGGWAAVAATVGVPEAIVDEVAQRASEKLTFQPIEDLRIDFEDGFTQRTVDSEQRDADEDHHVQRTAQIAAAWLGASEAERRSEQLPDFVGIRFKSFDPAVRHRGLRTVEMFLEHLHSAGVLGTLLAGQDSRRLRLTFPKVQHPDQVRVLVDIFSEWEKQWDLPAGSLCFEIQVEMPQAILGQQGAVAVSELIYAAQGRCLSVHYGTYDYSASLGIDASHQSMEHPVADFAKSMMQVAATSVGVEMSDGSTNQLPVGTAEDVRAGWELHHRLVTRHLRRGIRQGWDLHAHQLPTRHLATVEYFRADWQLTAERLRAYISGDTSRWLDEPATAKAMAGYLLRARDCHAITAEELATTGANEAQLRQLQRTGRLA